MQLWRANLDVPITYVYGGDVFSQAALTKSIVDNPWYYHNAYLGAPGEQYYYDYPLTDSLNFSILKLLSLGTSSYGRVQNLFFIFCFVLTTWTALAVFRIFGLAFLPSIVGSLLYAFLPYHFRHGEGHLLLSAYFMIPLIVMVYVWVLSDERLFPDHWCGLGGTWRQITPKGYASIAIAALMGCAGAYYSFFAAFLAGLIALSALLSPERRLRRFVAGSIVCAVVGSSFLLNAMPSMLFVAQHGNNAPSRIAFESEAYGLKVAQLILPPLFHRIPFFAHIRATYVAMGFNESDAVALGAFGAVGFCVLVVTFIWGVPTMRHSALLRRLGIVNLLAFLIGTVGGVGSVFALLVSPRIRCYNRIVVFLGFVSIWAVVLFLDVLWQRWSGSVLGRSAAAGVLACLAVGCILDQTEPNLVPLHERDRAAYAMQDEFIRRLESTLPPGSMVFQLPFSEFPEPNGEPGRMMTYDHFVAYLHSHHLRWSYGGFRGRYWDLWQRKVTSLTPEEMVDVLAVSGFSAVYVDRAGYVGSKARVEQRIAAILQVNPLVCKERRIAVYSLEAYTERLREQFSAPLWDAMREGVLHRLAVRWAGGFSELEGKPDNNWRWSSAVGELWVENTSARARQLQLAGVVATGYPEYSDMRIEGPGYLHKLRVNSAGQPFSVTISVPPGRHIVRWVSNSKRVMSLADPRVMVFQLRNFRVFASATKGLSAEWVRGCWKDEGTAEDGWRWCSARSELAVLNPYSEPRAATLRMRLITSTKSSVRVEGQSFSESVETNPSGTLYAKTILLPPGEQRLRLSTNAPRVVAPLDPRKMVMRVQDFYVQDPSRLASEVLFAN
jgi:phosphoglycerol transferase